MTQDAPPPAGPASGPELSFSGTGATGFGALPPDTLSKLDKLGGALPAEPAPISAKPPAQAAAKPAAPKPEAGSLSPPPAPGAPAADAAKPAAEPAAEVKGPKQLREAYERAQAKVAELETTMGATAKEKAEAFARLAATEEKLTSYEKRIADEYEPMRKVLTEREKRLAEVEENLRMRDYTATPEWHNNYVKPINDTWQEAVQFVSELAVQNADGSSIPATQEHLNYVIGAPNANEAARRAEQLFGNQSVFTGTLVNYRNKLKALQTKQQEAAKNAKLESEQWHQQRQAHEAEQLSKLRSYVTQREAAEGSDLAAIGDDPELRSALEAGSALADTLVNGDPKLSPENWADVIAKSRTHIKRSHVQAKRITRLEAKLKAAEEELGRYRNSEPSVETRPSGEVSSPQAEEGRAYWDGLPDRLLSHAAKKQR
jgi:hypothetical protein